MVSKSFNRYQGKKKTAFPMLRNALLFLFFSGKRYRCNICGHNFRRFTHDPNLNRENVCCPECGSLESDRVLWFYLTNEVFGKRNKNKFLYFSPDSAILEKLGHYPVQTDVESIGYFEKLIDQQIEKLPGGKYDVIIFAQLLQIVSDEQETFAELKRLLRTGGFIIIMTLVNWSMDRTYEKPASDEDKDRLKNFYFPGIERVYGSDIAKRLVKAGFDVETIDYADLLGNSAREYYRLGEGAREIIFKCKKL
jgi:SAM-dependent methyltransferase